MIEVVRDNIDNMPVRLASIESGGVDMKFGSGESLIRRDSTDPLERTASPKGSVEIVQEEESEGADVGTHAELPLLKRRRMAKITVFNETGNIVGMRIVTGEEEIVRILGENISSLYS
jgi:hypothetical protein